MACWKRFIKHFLPFSTWCDDGLGPVPEGSNMVQCQPNSDGFVSLLGFWGLEVNVCLLILIHQGLFLAAKLSSWCFWGRCCVSLGMVWLAECVHCWHCCVLLGGTEEHDKSSGKYHEGRTIRIYSYAFPFPVPSHECSITLICVKQALFLYPLLLVKKFLSLSLSLCLSIVRDCLQLSHEKVNSW